MSATITGCLIVWPAEDTTPVVLATGVSGLYINAGTNILVQGESDATGMVIDGAANKYVKFSDVGGYPNKLTPTKYSGGSMRVLVTPSPHINPHYVSDCQKLLEAGYDA